MLHLPIFGEPQLPGEVQTAAEEGIRTRLAGTVQNRQIKENSVQYVLKNCSFTFRDETYYLKKIKITDARGAEVFPVGSDVQAKGTLRRIAQATCPGQFDARAYYATLGIYYDFWLDGAQVESPEAGGPEVLASIRERALLWQSNMLGEERAGVLAAMVLGERSLLTDESRDDYRVAGIFHIICISGLHISLLGMLLYRGLFCLLLAATSALEGRARGAIPGLGEVMIRKPVAGYAAKRVMAAAAILSAAVMAGYVWFVGSPPSALRALIMFCVMLGAKLAGRSYDPMSALSLAGVLLLLMRPAVLFHGGFQLSFVAVIGAGGVAPAVMRLLPGAETRRTKERWRYLARRLRDSLLQGAVLYLCVTAVSLPLVAWHYCEIPVWGLLANLTLVPLVGVVLASGLLGTAACLLGAVVTGRVLFLPADLLLRLFSLVSGAVRRLPFSSWICGRPSVPGIAAYYFLLGSAMLFLLYGRKGADKKTGEACPQKRRAPARRRGFFGLAAVALAVLLLFLRPLPGFSLVMLDVGQGDCFVLRNGRSVFLIDGGSTNVSEVGKYRIIPYLKSEGIRTIDGIFVTHDDEDHTAGVEELLEGAAEGGGIRVSALLMPAWMRKNPVGQELEEKAFAAGAEVYYVQPDDVISTGEVTLTVLAPGKMLRDAGGNQADRAADASQLTGNAGSLVLHLRYGIFDALFTGDLEGEGEEAILPFLPDVDLLKVAHHGSRGSTSAEFLARCAPEICLISAPDGGRYGHPHQETLDRIEEAGAACFVTRDCGTVTVEVRDEQVRIRAYYES